MMNRNKTVVFSAMLVALSCFGVGCGGDDEATESQQPVVRNIPKAKPRPQAKTVEELHSSLSIDERIQMNELDAPRDEASRVAVLTFIDAMLNVDSNALGEYLSPQDQIQLQAMVADGLSSYMQQISMVQLSTGSSTDGKSCVLALFEVGLDYQIQVWLYENNGDGFSFEAGPTRPNLVNKLNGNWLVNYFEQRDKQVEIANQPDAGASYTLAGETTTLDDLDEGQREGPKGPRGPGGPSGPGK
jgi:hypothetical protein